MVSKPNEKTPHGKSTRAGKRTIRTKAKTARVCGSNYTPTKSWKDRKQTGDY